MADNTFEMEFSWPSDDVPLPGQFFSLRCADSTDPLLRRPFAFSGFNAHSARASFIYLRRGRSTTLLSQLGVGAQIDILGPLGKGFSPPAAGRMPLLAAGGIGFGPILFLYDHLMSQGFSPRLFYGARTASLVPRDRLPQGSIICSDDGSSGRAGTVLDAMVAEGIPESASLYACGPGPMLKALAAKAGQLALPCQVAIEQHMACGVGACMGCSVKVKDERKFARACVEGPVFNAEELIWD